MIDWLDDTQPPKFPKTSQALDDPNGLLAAGGGLSPLWLDEAYRNGVFPWNDPDEVRLWWSPAPRAVITRDSFRISRTVRKLIKRLNKQTITINQAFDQVIDSCAEPRDYQQGTWIDEDILHHYKQLRLNGRALSIEHWSCDGELIGGCYGVVKGAVFFGESMFSREPNASKIAFAVAAPALFKAGIQLIDCQMHTDHLAQFGAQEIDRHHFETLLQQHTQLATSLKLPTVIDIAKYKQ